MEKKDLGRCSQKVYGNSRYDSFHPHPCYFKGVVVYEGKVYCKRHNPVYIEKKRKEKSQERVVEEQGNSKALSVFLSLAMLGALANIQIKTSNKYLPHQGKREKERRKRRLK